ncbi:uncharacterized protein LOC105827943 [Monomorium pharaonis]|uniref:uncharacterized protein LOC105827943 n=1 Tax=Monomorium pharaonis TaxID=307658 RepID=UPI00102E1EBE|nr:uncharacterized protein LOC105827943 [Monomorium pharaonis]
MKRKTQCFQSQVDTMSNAFRNKESREKTCKFMTKVRLAKEVKLIRMFPGPAGLIPDQAKNSNTSAVPSYPSSINELEDKTTATKMNRHIKIKSQDEKNLFGEKAWKLLFNDLPNNFLQDYKISTIKNKANASRCDSTRVRFIAGVLDYVDHSHDDPFVVLKDSTDSIEGIIHRDIPLTYPGILEPNVVILLHDVGLLKTTTYVVTNKYHILVSLVNLLAIYTDKGRIVSTSLMESMLSNTWNTELNKIDNFTPESVSEQSSYVSGLQKMDKGRNAPSQISTSIDRSPSTKDHKSELAKNPLLPNCSTKDEKYGSCEKIFKNNDKNGKDEMCGRSNFFSYSMDTDDVDMDGFFTTDYDFTTLDEQNCSSSKSISQTNEVEWRDSQVQNTRHFENTKKESIRNVEEQIKKQHLRENNFSFYNDTAYRDLNLNKVKTTLIEHNAGNSKALISYFTNDKCDEYDSDDEILSQLNVDNIFDKLKNDC